MQGKTKKTVVFSLAAATLLFAIIGTVKLSKQGYRLGLRTKDADKQNFKQELCIHTWDRNRGVCISCGLECSHPEYSGTNRCVVCGYMHIHNYQDSVCVDCGHECSHESWSKGKCTSCGKQCTHPEWKEDVCTVCGLYCTHTDYTDGKCTMCGIACPHRTWEDGFCTVCGIECEHEDHDPQTCFCRICGKTTLHRYVNGRCSCGATPPVCNSMLPDALMADSGQAGTVTTVQYSTKKYAGANEPLIKLMDVYTPHGYSSTRQYDVLVLIHGSGGNYVEWTTNPITVQTYMTCPRNIYDNMIAKKLCDPFIIVSVETVVPGADGYVESGYKQMTPELRNDILPYIAEHYSTYAKTPSLKGISEARNHFGIGGVGTGAQYAYRCGMKDNFDLFSNFICISGCSCADDCIEAINSEDNKDLPIVCYYAATGSADSYREQTRSGFQRITDSTRRLSTNDNAFFTEVQGGTFGWTTWTTGIYNGLLMAFQQR